jgi:hypothetical protein
MLLRQFVGLVGFLSIVGLLYFPTGDLAWLGFFGFSGWFAFFAMGEGGKGRLGSDFDRSARNGFIVAMGLVTLFGGIITVGFLIGPVTEAYLSLALHFSTLLTSLVAILLLSLLVFGISMIYYYRLKRQD